MSGGAKLNAAAGGSVTMVVDDTLTTDEVYEVPSSTQQGLATAWVNFNGITSTINDSYNIASVVKVMDGVHTVTFSTPMDNKYYVMASMASPSVASAVNSSIRVRDEARKTTISVDVTSTQLDDLVDFGSVSLVFFGGKA